MVNRIIEEAEQTLIKVKVDCRKARADTERSNFKGARAHLLNAEASLADLTLYAEGHEDKISGETLSSFNAYLRQAENTRQAARAYLAEMEDASFRQR